MSEFEKQHELDCWYWCVVCNTCIEGGDIEDRHTAPDLLNDCHAECCPTCNGGM